MKKKATYNILMYSHDTYGLGHIRRTMAIAAHLCQDDVNILILTGSPIVGRFVFPERIDFVRIPGMIKTTNQEYQPLSVKIHPDHALNIRKSIIAATAKTFKPDLFIVDKEPLGLRKEVLSTLKWFKKYLPGTQSILGLRDVMDDAETVKQDWRSKGVYEYLTRLYDEIWVYGHQALYDPVVEYDIPDNVSKKMKFVGYIPRKISTRKAVEKIRRYHQVTDKLVVVTTGGGGDGYEVMDAFLSMLEEWSGLPPFKSVLVTGPFMPKTKRRQIAKRAKPFGIRTMPFYPRMEELFAAADLVVSMGGYNTMCELLTQQTPSVIVPRETPRKEQLIRAVAFQKKGLIEYVPWKDLTPDNLRIKMLQVLQNPGPYKQAMKEFRLTGLEFMLKRLEEFKNA
ncbi:MAG: glycosyltransferase [Deltaproteobacteria bacterium]|nr:glycosyltransferase [Deltaproteobacteria bacterium]